MYHKLIAFTIFISVVFSQATAQDYAVNPKTQRINDIKYSGFSIRVEGTLSKVTDQTYIYLKAKSKLRRKRNYYSITALQLDKIKLDSTVIYLKIDDKFPQTAIWVGIKTTGLAEKRIHKIESELQKELVHIARSYYVHEQELKILEAETAAQIISKNQQSLISSHTKLTTDLTEAEARKLELDELLKTNQLDIGVLKQKLIDNKFAQDSVYLDLQKVNRVIEGQKQKLKEID